MSDAQTVMPLATDAERLVTRTARFWLVGDTTGWAHAAKQSRAAFRAGISAWAEGKPGEAGQRIREAAPHLLSRIRETIKRPVVKGAWKSYRGLKKRYYHEERWKVGERPPRVPGAKAYSHLAVSCTRAAPQLDRWDLRLRMSMWSPDYHGYSGPSDYELVPWDEGWDDELVRQAAEVQAVILIRYHERRDAWYICVPTKQQAAPLREGGEIAGIDIGYRKHFAVISAPGISKCEFWRYGEVRDRDRRDQKLRGRLNSMGRRRAATDLTDRMQRYRRSYLMETVAAIVQWCLEDGVTLVRIERLEGIADRAEDWSKAARAELKRWPWAWFKKHLFEKLDEVGIRLEEVDPKHTSQQCSECGHRERANRSGGRFRCRQCGHETNADLNAANNIAARPGTEVVRDDL